MLIMSPAEAAIAIQAACGGSPPSAADPRLQYILSYITPRVEAAMNVATLTYGHYEDVFQVVCSPNSGSMERQLRLSNAFVLDASLSVTDPYGTVTLDTASDVFVNYELGTVNVKCTGTGMYKVAYYSGFTASAIPDPIPVGWQDAFRYFTNTPAWIRGMAIGFLTKWFRTMPLNPNLPKDVSLSALERDLDREIYARVYGSFMRPRVDVVFAERRATLIPPPPPAPPAPTPPAPEPEPAPGP